MQAYLARACGLEKSSRIGRSKALAAIGAKPLTAAAAPDSTARRVGAAGGKSDEESESRTSSIADENRGADGYTDLMKCLRHVFVRLCDLRATNHLSLGVKEPRR